MVWFSRYGQEEWFPPITSYVVNRHRAIQSRLEIAFRFIEPDGRNGDTYSYELASILRDSSALFASTLEAIMAETGHGMKNVSIGPMLAFLSDEVEDLDRASVMLRAPTVAGVIVPFSGITLEPLTSPTWWTAYNKLKHDEFRNRDQGTLENALHAVAAVVLLASYVGGFRSDSMWVNVGLTWRGLSPTPTPREFRLMFDD